MTDKIDETLDLVSIDEVEGENLPTKREDSISKEDEDLELARENLHNLIEGGQAALQELSGLATSSQMPECFDSISRLTKAMLEANRDLVKLAEKRKEEKGESGKGNNVNNHLYVGSTKELLEVIKAKKESDDSTK